MAMKIYFKVGNEIKDFYFVTIGKDESVYFGSAATKCFTKGYTGTSIISEKGTQVNIYDNGRPLTLEEIKMKCSLHKSGILSTSSIENGRRRRYQIKELSQYKEPIPLVGIFPMNITKYPLTNNKIKKDDMLINAEGFIKPFAMLLYIKSPNQEDPVLVNNKERWDMTFINYGRLGKYIVCVFIYSNYKLFKGWPPLEVNLLAHPNQETGKLLFPIINSG